ncbi:MAG: SIS domain-containing protein, partial [Actinomycetota bacterium]
MVRSTGGQLRDGYRMARSTAGLPSGRSLHSVAVCGMGGSGVAGDILRTLYAGRLPVPIIAVKGYELPAFCGRDTLVLAVSFSGNTEETLAAYGEAVERGCRVVAISAGGELASRAADDHVAHVELPGHVPVPRAALGYTSAVPIGLLEAMGLTPPAGEEIDRAEELLDEMSSRLGPELPLPENEAKQLAAWIGDRTPVVWGSEGVAAAAAVRWKTQLNENGK